MEQVWADTRQVTDYGHLIMSWQGHMAIGPSVTLNMQTNVEVSNPKAKVVFIQLGRPLTGARRARRSRLERDADTLLSFFFPRRPVCQSRSLVPYRD